MDNVIFVDFVRKEIVTPEMSKPLQGLLMNVYNCTQIMGLENTIAALKLYVDIERN